MFKKLLFMLILVDICGFYLAFKALTVELPWFTARQTQAPVGMQHLDPAPICNAITAGLSPDSLQGTRKADWEQAPDWELSFSPDGSLLAATDGIELHIWRVKDGTLLYAGKTPCS